MSGIRQQNSLIRGPTCIVFLFSVNLIYNSVDVEWTIEQSAIEQSETFVHQSMVNSEMREKEIKKKNASQIENSIHRFWYSLLHKIF